MQLVVENTQLTGLVVTSRTMTTNSIGSKQKTRPDSGGNVCRFAFIVSKEKEEEIKSAHSGLRWWSSVYLLTVITSAKHLGDVFSGSAQR